MAYTITDKCQGCGMCEGMCDEGAIYYNEDLGRYAIDPEKCISCGNCANVCYFEAPCEAE